MNKRFSDEQLISILRGDEAEVSARELCHKHAISDTTFTPGARSMEVWRCTRLNA